MWASDIVLAGRKLVRVTPLRNALGWEQTHRGPGLAVKLNATRGDMLRDGALVHQDSFTAGDVFTLHAGHLHQVETSNGPEGFSLMLSCRDASYVRDPFGWLASLRNVENIGENAIIATRAYFGRY